MTESTTHRLDWVVLTTGDRPDQLEQAVRSLCSDESGVVVVSNGAGSGVVAPATDVQLVETSDNLGVPGGRDVGLRSCAAPVLGFLDDDAVFHGDQGVLLAAFGSDPRLAAVSLRIVDERGQTTPRHVPRVGGTHPEVGGPVASFLGGACAIRRSAYEEVGGYFTDLFYGHEEVELSWRLVDAGWHIRYLADVEVFHPRTEISRHEDGWRLTGRNRVWIARRSLPWPVAVVHTTNWLVLGLVRAPRGCRAAYLHGWWSGWRTTWSSAVHRRPIRWSTVWRLTRRGRPPII